MSRETVVWTTSKPLSLSADATSACVESARSRTSSRMALCLSRRFIVCATLAEYAVENRREPRRPRPRVTVSGGASRTTFSPAVRTRRPSLARSIDDVRRGAVDLDAEQQPATAHGDARREAARAPRRAARRARARCRAAPSSIARRRRSAAAHDTGFPPKVEPWSPGANAPAASSATSSAPIGSPFARPFARVTRSGRTPSCSNAKNDPVRPTPVCTSSKQRSGGELGRGRDELGVERNRRRPHRGSARAGSARPPSSTAALQRVDVVRRNEAHAGNERLERRALAPVAPSPRARPASCRGSRLRARRRPASRSPCART